MSYCASCGAEEFGNHHGGTATCVSGAFCEDSGQTYTAPSTQHSISDWYSDSETQHFRYCTMCSRAATYEYANHDVGGLCTGPCSICGKYAVMPDGKHVMSDWCHATMDQHAKYCMKKKKRMLHTL